MNSRDLSLPDIQALPDARNIAIDAVGIRDLRYPVTLLAGGRPVGAVATFAMTVGLHAAAKGTHMSRFVEILESQREPLDRVRFLGMVERMRERLGAASGRIEMRFTHFVRKTAPVSGVSSLIDVDACWTGHRGGDGESAMRIRVTVPATSLCPCSKEISDYGAHNQRSHITIDALVTGEISIDELVGLAQRNASCEVYGLLKRADERHVTQQAYDNPRFVEDIVRDVAVRLNAEPRVRAYVVEAENFESIHNHSAYALVEEDKDRP